MARDETSYRVLIGLGAVGQTIDVDIDGGHYATIKTRSDIHPAVCGVAILGCGPDDAAMVEDRAFTLAAGEQAELSSAARKA
jgi:hypothetical protein